MSAGYYPVNVLFMQLPALHSDFFFFPGHSVWVTLSLFVAQIYDRKYRVVPLTTQISQFGEHLVN